MGICDGLFQRVVIRLHKTSVLWVMNVFVLKRDNGIDGLISWAIVVDDELKVCKNLWILSIVPQQRFQCFCLFNLTVEYDHYSKYIHSQSWHLNKEAAHLSKSIVSPARCSIFPLKANPRLLKRRLETL